MAFGNAIQVADDAHRVEFWHQLIDVFLPLALVLDRLADDRILRRLEFRAAMAALDDRLLHLALAAEFDALQARARAATPPTTPTSVFRRTSALSSMARGTGSNSGNVGIYNYSISDDFLGDQSGRVLDHPLGPLEGHDGAVLGIEIPGLLFWVATIYAVFATGVTQLIGRKLAALYFKQQAVEANFRFDLARIREYSEQIALLKGENREIAHAGEVFEDVFRTIQRIIRLRVRLIAFNQFYSQISVIIPYVIIAPFYFAKKVSFGTFNQAADAFGNVNTQMNFFVDRYIGLADFSATISRLTSFDEAFVRTQAAWSRDAARRGAPIRRRGARHSRSRTEPAGRPQARPRRQCRARAAGADAAARSERRRQIHAVPRRSPGYGPMARAKCCSPPHAKLMLLPQRPYIPIGPLKDAIAYPSNPSVFTTDQMQDSAARRRLDGLRRAAGGKRQLADAALGRRAAAARRRARAARQA